MQFRYATTADWTDAWIGAGIAILLASRGFGFRSMVYGQLAGTTCSVLLKLYFTGWRPSFRVTRQALRELLSFGLALQTKRLLEYATYNLDTLVVGKILGMTSLGLYDKAFSTMNRIVNR